MELTGPSVHFEIVTHPLKVMILVPNFSVRLRAMAILLQNLRAPVALIGI